MQTGFSLILFETADNEELVGYPEGATSDVLAELEIVAPHIRTSFREGAMPSVRAVGLVPAGTQVSVVRRDEIKVLCNAADRTFVTAVSALID